MINRYVINKTILDFVFIILENVNLRYQKQKPSFGPKHFL